MAHRAAQAWIHDNAIWRCDVTDHSRKREQIVLDAEPKPVSPPSNPNLRLPTLRTSARLDRAQTQTKVDAKEKTQASGLRFRARCVSWTYSPKPSSSPLEVTGGGSGSWQLGGEFVVGPGYVFVFLIYCYLIFTSTANNARGRTVPPALPVLIFLASHYLQRAYHNPNPLAYLTPLEQQCLTAHAGCVTCYHGRRRGGVRECE